jgi:hypothetical protein
MFFPLINPSLLFITNSYQIINDNPWCTFAHDNNNVWTVLFYLGMTWLVYFACILVILYTICRTYQTALLASHSQIFHTFFNTIGWYCIFGILLDVPISILQFVSLSHLSTSYDYFYSYLPTALGGFGYITIFFYKEHRVLLQLEEHIGEDGNRSSFSWEDNDVFELFARQSDITGSGLNSTRTSFSIQSPRVTVTTREQILPF